MSNTQSLRGKRINDTFSRIVQVVDNVLYDGLGNPIELQGITGPTGPAGSVGTTGPQGPTGTNYFGGTVAPTGQGSSGTLGEYRISGADLFFHDGSNWWKTTGSSF
jgi:hypothetical protein